MFIKIFCPFSKKKLLQYSIYLSFIFSFFSSSFAQVEQLKKNEVDFFQKNGVQPFISKEQDGEYPSGTYLVPHDLIIEKGKVMTLYSGTTLLFKKDTRIIVKGTLVCQGKSGEPVIFTKLDNALYFNPLDSSIETWWDGIYVSDSASLEMSRTEIANSKYGIVAQPSAAKIKLDSIQFLTNKYHSIRFGNELPDVPDNKNISFYWSGLDDKLPEIKINDTIKKPNSSFIPTTNALENSIESTKKPSPHRKKLRYISGGTALLGAALGITGLYINQHYFSMYLKNNDPGTTSTEDHYRTISTEGYHISICGAGITILGICGLTLTFVF